MTTTAPARVPLTAMDRCDRCGAQAFVRAVLASGDLLFCAHHARSHRVALDAQAAVVQDGTAAINTRPSTSAY